MLAPVLDELIGQPVGRIRDDALDPVQRTPLKQEVAARAGLNLKPLAALAAKGASRHCVPDPALPGAYALWAVRAGRSVRNIYRAKVFPPLDFPHTKTSPREGSREPRLTRTRAGFLFNHPSHRWHTEAVGSLAQMRSVSF
jgi:hypothetical protein